MEGLPDFHEIKLFFGTLELCEGLCGEVRLSPDAEITIMKSASPALAVEAVREYYYNYHQPLHERMQWTLSGRSNIQQRRCVNALTFLGDIGILDDKDQQVLVDLFDEYYFVNTHCQVLAKVQSAFAKTFATCCSSEVVVACVQRVFEHGNDLDEWFFLVATIALGEVLARDPVALLSNLIGFLLTNMVRRINLCIDSNQSFYLPPHIDLLIPSLMATCRLASSFADAALLRQIQMGVERLSYELDAASYETITLCLRDPGPSATAAAPLEVVEPRDARTAQHPDATAEFEEALPTTTEQRDHQISKEAETEQSLDHALQESESEAWMQEQGHLHEALLRSKADGFLVRARDESVGTDRCLVLIRFSRCPKKMFDVLLASPLATRLVQAGVVLQPSWATGRLVLAAGVDADIVSETRDPWNLVVSSEDEHEVLDLLRGIEHAERPRLKLDGRFPIPGDVSLFNDLTEDHSELGEDWKQVPVIRTFLHVPALSVLDPRTSSSAPAAF